LGPVIVNTGILEIAPLQSGSPYSGHSFAFFPTTNVQIKMANPQPPKARHKASDKKVHPHGVRHGSAVDFGSFLGGKECRPLVERNQVSTAAAHRAGQ
jgi:hypothetical protein